MWFVSYSCVMVMDVVVGAELRALSRCRCCCWFFRFQLKQIVAHQKKNNFQLILLHLFLFHLMETSNIHRLGFGVDLSNSIWKVRWMFTCESDSICLGHNIYKWYRDQSLNLYVLLAALFRIWFGSKCSVTNQWY